MKIGPFCVSVNWFVWKLNRFVPMMSPGIRSGVNCTRPNCIDRQLANDRTSSVLATPGTPSSRIVAAAQQRGHEQEIDRLILADDDPMNLLAEASCDFTNGCEIHASSPCRQR